MIEDEREAKPTEPGDPEDLEGSGAPRFRALVAYDGGRFHGWQAQRELITVQGEIERAIFRVTGRSIRIQGAGRTDAGVHALGQVASFSLVTRLPPAKLRLALNAHLPPDIRIHLLEGAPDDFSARFSACWRRYHYVLSPRPSPFLRGRAYVPRIWPQIDRMQAACPSLLGEQDFRALTTQKEGPFGCRVSEAVWVSHEQLLVFGITANRFLYQMVRILVGTFLEIGRERREPSALARILSQGDRRAAGPLAPPCGLYMAAVGYDPPWPIGQGAEGFVPAREGLCLPLFPLGAEPTSPVPERWKQENRCNGG